MKIEEHFQIGDLVHVDDGTFKGENVIVKISIRDFVKGIPIFEYATDRGAWISHRKCTLISHATEQTYKAVKRALLY